MPRRSHSEPKCPQCGSELKRRHRSPEEARESSDFRRYRCTAEGCNWDGVLPRSARRSRTVSLPKKYSSPALPTQLWLVMGGLFVLLVVGASILMHMAFREEPGVLATGKPLQSTTSNTPNAAPALQPRK